MTTNDLFMQAITQPLGLFILALGAGFLIPLFYRANKTLALSVFFATLAALVFIAGSNLLALVDGAPTIIIETAGIQSPFSINLRFGLFEGGFVLAVNTVALLAAWHYLPMLKQHASALLLYLILVMGINGMVMTRDLFNLFIFIEISSIATYALIGMGRGGAVLAAGFKYIIATSIASAFFLLGTTFLYYQTGTLNIDDLIAHADLIRGPIGFISLIFLLTSLIIELKPYPANGWGLDVYETAPSGIASLISVGVSAGMFFALYKLLPLFSPFLSSISLIGGLTFILSNLIGLKQDNSKRLLGYSSIGQIGLLLLALSLLTQFNEQQQIPLIVGGLFINHLFAKAGLFWLAGVVDRPSIRDWSAMTKRPQLLLLFAILITALVGLPPFPGFWAKWQLILTLASHAQYVWIVLILFASLLEVAYLFRWFSYARQDVSKDVSQNKVATNAIDEIKSAETKSSTQVDTVIATNFFSTNVCSTLAIWSAVLLLFAIGYAMATTLPIDSTSLFLPLVVGFALWLIDGVNSRFRDLPMLVGVAFAGYLLTADLVGINQLFSYLLIGGGLLLSIAAVYRHDQRKGYYPLLGVLLLSLASLLHAQNSLEFFFSWELMTLSSYLLVSLGHSPLSTSATGKGAIKASLTYLLFSLASAYFILTGFAVAYAATGNIQLAGLANSGTAVNLIYSLLAIGFLTKMGAFGVHIWLPDAYGESDDDFSAILSAVVSKAGVFGLIIIAAHLGVRSGSGIDATYVLGWIGILTATFGALMAAFQEDIKKLVAYSSMGQLGYIVTGIAIMSHLGWVAAMYMTVNHFLFKGILFLSVAGVILRTNERLMYKMGGLIKNMPVTFTATLIAIIAMSGVPPLSGYGGKWMLFNALMDKGWVWIAALAFFSSAVAFLYMFRLLHNVFLGQRKLEHAKLKEAPVILLIPQLVMIAGIMVISANPKLLIDQLSAVINPWISNTLVWDGFTMQAHYGYWNAPSIMLIVAGVWLVPLIALLLFSMTMKIQKVEQFNIVYAAERPRRPEETHFAYKFYAHYDRAIGFMVRPRATAFWNGSVEWSHSLASSVRVFYNGNGQTYALFVIIYLVAMFVFNGGLSL